MSEGEVAILSHCDIEPYFGDMINLKEVRGSESFSSKLKKFSPFNTEPLLTLNSALSSSLRAEQQSLRGDALSVNTNLPFESREHLGIFGRLSFASERREGQILGARMVQCRLDGGLVLKLKNRFPCMLQRDVRVW